jgi:hypothetical protein
MINDKAVKARYAEEIKKINQFLAIQKKSNVTNLSLMNGVLQTDF